MRYFMVMQKTEVASVDDPSRWRSVRLLRDGFSFWAFAFGPFWLLWHRAWRAALVFFALNVFALFVSKEFAGWVSVASALVLGFEGQNLVATAMQRRGWELIGVIAAADRDEAELRLAQRLSKMGAAGGDGSAAHAGATAALRGATA